MLYGILPVAEALRQRRRQLTRLYLKSGISSARIKEILQLARAAKVPYEEKSAHELSSLAKSRHHQGVVLQCGPLPLLSLEEVEAGPGTRSLLVALDQIEDPQNLGGIARSAAFLGADAMLVLRSHSAPLSPAASRASAGALEFFKVAEVANLSTALLRLADAGYFLVGAALEEAIDFHQVEPRERCVLVLGNEGGGLRKLTRKRCEVLVQIPRVTRGNIEMESLNVNVAAGILLSHFGRV
ncbi:MAG TPA: 23S rRNA (guanosine(2251)-2'-O)-methyltransferase RlmB [Candidatus Krumholzibacteria bacterium]|nr:23S rRNA (guanosine(2251)-2'-O)-methyltransferase RlmB [Candidatus Krumholzibacteria bacterium]